VSVASPFGSDFVVAGVCNCLRICGHGCVVAVVDILCEVMESLHADTIG